LAQIQEDILKEVVPLQLEAGQELGQQQQELDRVQMQWQLVSRQVKQHRGWPQRLLDGRLVRSLRVTTVLLLGGLQEIRTRL
jgi:hypothetical protein